VYLVYVHSKIREVYIVGCKLIGFLFTQMALIELVDFAFIFGIVIWSVRKLQSVNIVRFQL
jgi:hypothetical protein